nr:unnamed protein product [Callosobruchus analis]
MKFLELYQMHPCIWDPKNSAHKNKKKVSDAWTDIKKKHGTRVHSYAAKKEERIFDVYIQGVQDKNLHDLLVTLYLCIYKLYW